jgi:hypothetical protein
MKLARILALFCFLLITNRWASYQQGINIFKAEDTIDYMAIAAAAPHLPSPSLEYHHAQRLVVPFVIGIASKSLGLSYEKMFLIAALLCCALVIVVADLIFDELKLSPPVAFLCLSLLVLNPYTFRYYLAVPVMINDLVFVLGLAIGILGLFKKKFVLVLGGLILAAIGRQTAILLLPGFILWFYRGAGWREFSAGRKVFFSALCCLAVLGVYELTAYAASFFSARNLIGFDLLGMYYWLRRTPHVVDLLTFVARGVVPFLFPLALLIAAGWSFPQKAALPEFLLCILMTALLVSQPVLAGPAMVTKNMTRLSSLGFFPLLIALALRLQNVRFDFQSPRFFLLIALIVFGSFHHMSSIIAGDMSLAPWFSLVYFCLACFSGWLTRTFRSSENLAGSRV